MSPPDARPEARGRRRAGTIALSWGPWGGFYLNRWHRLCLGWVALTYVPIEVDDMMEAWARERERGTVDAADATWTTSTVDPQFMVVGDKIVPLSEPVDLPDEVDGSGYTRGAP